MTSTATGKRYFVSFMRGYGSNPYWVRDAENDGNGIAGSYASNERAQRFADWMNAGASREAAMQALSQNTEIVHVGSLVFFDSFAGLIPAKVVECKRVPVPGAPNTAYTMNQLTIQVTADRPGFRKGERITREGELASAIVARKSVRRRNGQFVIRSAVFDAWWGLKR